MARSRNIKPSFFSNDELAECEPLGRLLFIGLWTLADYKGDLEYRPKRLKAQLLPYDDCDLEKIVTDLYKSRFITIYHDHGFKYIHINNFAKHQNPHPNEVKKGSEIPAFNPDQTQVVDFKEVVTNHDLSRQERDDSITNPADSLFLIPDSLNLIPDTCNPIPDSINLIPSKNTVTLKRDDARDVFEHWQSVMNHKQAAFDDKRRSIIKKWLNHYTVEQMRNAIDGCAVTPHNMGDNDRGQRYDGLELIFRNADQIDRFIRNCFDPPAGKIKTIEQTQSQARAQADRVRDKLFGSQT